MDNLVESVFWSLSTIVEKRILPADVGQVPTLAEKVDKQH